MAHDLARLKCDFPLWRIGTVAVEPASGIGHYRLYARRGDVLVTAADPAELRRLIEHEEKNGQFG